MARGEAAVTGGAPSAGVVLRPGPWARLWAAGGGWRGALAVIEEALGELPGSEPWRSMVAMRGRSLSRALVGGNRDEALRAALELAGLGEGSTPAGDDYLMGVAHATWAADLPLRGWANAIASAAEPRTTPASARWLAAAGRGDVGPAWWDLLATLPCGESASLRAAALAVRARGHTSGAYSLRGFLDLLAADVARC